MYCMYTVQHSLTLIHWLLRKAHSEEYTVISFIWVSYFMCMGLFYIGILIHMCWSVLYMSAKQDSTLK